MALDEVRVLLGDQPRRPDLLIEFLHRIQDAYRCVSTAHLAALAHELRLALAEVYEVATFYARFDVVQDHERPPPPLTLRICDGVPCAMAGATRLRDALEGRCGDRVRIVRTPCVGRCAAAPAAELGRNALERATPDAVLAAIRDGRTEPELPAYPDYAAYRAEGGYDLLEACRAGDRSVEAVIATLEAADLPGLGGAGFPAGRKWRLVRREPRPRRLVLNADEGEPGTFKDRFFLEREPHRVLEGMLVAAWAVEAQAATIYLRDEYPGAREILLREIPMLESAGLVAPGFLELRRGAGAYICGEESAMLESIEGRRGLPRHRPPYPAQVGLFGRPTLIHNVETVYWIRALLERGGEWFAAQGRRGHTGMRAFSVSGRVREPGVKIAPAGITVRELIDEHSGGMQEGHGFRGYLPGGASGGILPASLGDLPLAFGVLESHGGGVGSGAVIVLSDQDDVREVALGLLRFFEDESCGQCSPCRVGTEKAVALMERPTWDAPLLEELCGVLADASICGLGQAAANPLRCLLRHFASDVPGAREVAGNGGKEPEPT